MRSSNAGQVKCFCAEGSEAEDRAHHFLGPTIQVSQSELNLVNPRRVQGSSSRDNVKNLDVEREL